MGKSLPRFRKFEPDLLSRKGEAVSLSDPGDLLEMLHATLEKGALFRFRAKGFSMSPFIRDDDVVTVSPLRGLPCRVGDVVAFVSPYSQRLMLHRVVGRGVDSCLIRGDHAPASDGLIPNASILGRVSKVERNGKDVLLGLGFERLLIACLVRMGLFSSFLLPIWRRIHPIVKKWRASS